MDIDGNKDEQAIVDDVLIIKNNQEPEQIAACQNDPLVNFTYAHTTGHATLDTLKKLVDYLQPKTLVPVHSEFPEDYTKHFKMVTLLKDGDSLNLS